MAGGTIDKTFLQDFKLLYLVADLNGRMYLNIGSAVLLPALFLKERNACHNLSHPAARFTTVNLDYIRHYRPTQAVGAFISPVIMH